MSRRISISLSLGLAILLAPIVRADLNISTIGSPVTITFDATLTDVNNGAFNGGGFSSSPSSGQLDSDSWAITGNGNGGPNSDGTLNFGQTHGSPNSSANPFRRGASQEDVDNAGIWSFDHDNGGKAGEVNRGLGVLQANDNFTPGTITLRVKNDTGVAAAFWSIDYDLYTYNNTDSSSSITFSYSTDDSTYTSIGALDFTSPVTRDTGVNVGANTDWSAATNRSTTIQVTVPNTGNLYLRWTFNDSVIAVDRDQLAIDDIRVMAMVPEPGAILFGGVVIAAVGIGAFGRRFVGRLGRGRGRCAEDGLSASRDGSHFQESG